MGACYWNCENYYYLVDESIFGLLVPRKRQATKKSTVFADFSTDNVAKVSIEWKEGCSNGERAVTWRHTVL